MAKKESIVPGLGKKQIAVLNNEHARQLEHKRHLEELGFPEEVEPGFVRHAPVSYDDPSNPTPSKIVNQAGQDLGDPNREGSDHFKEFKYKPAKNIAKEAFLDFMQKQPTNVTTPLGEPGDGSFQFNPMEDSNDASSAGLPAGVSGPGNSVLANYQRSIDPSMTTNVAGTRDANDALFGIDPTGAGIGSENVGMTGTPGAGTADMENFKPATGTEDILNADFDTKMNEAQTRQIVKEAVSEVFLSKYKGGWDEIKLLFQSIGALGGGLWAGGSGEAKDRFDKVQEKFEDGKNVSGKEIKDLEDSLNEAQKMQIDQLTYDTMGNTLTALSEAFTGEEISPDTTVDPKATDPVGVPLASQPGGRPDAGKPYTPGKGQTKDQSTQTITVDPNTPDASGVPQGFQPGGFVGGTFESGKGQTMDQSNIEKPPTGETFESTYKPPTTTQGQLQADPGKAFAEQFGNRPDFDMSSYGSTSAGRTLAVDEGLVDGKQLGTISGPGTSDYRIEVDPKNYPDAKPGKVLNLSKMDAYNAWIEKAEGEGAMAKVQLDRVSDLAAMMHDILEDGDELPGWIQNKISDSLHNLEASVSHIMYDEKEERGLVKSKHTFQDFLAKAPQSGGEHLEKVAPLVAPFAAAVGGTAARTALLSAFPLVAKGLLKLIPKLFKSSFTKTVPKVKNGRVVTRTVKNPKTGLDETEDVMQRVLAPGKTALNLGSAAFLYDTVADPDWSPFEGLDDDPDFKDANQQYKEMSPEEKKAANAFLGDEVAKEIDKQPQDIQDANFETYKNLSEGNTTIGEVLSASQAADVGASDRGPKYGYGAGEDWKATDPSIRSTDKDPKFKGVSFTKPVYDTSPEQTAKVRAGGPEKIIGYKVDGGETTKLKTPVSNMGDLNRMLVKEAFIELQKERKKDSRLKNAGVAGYNKPKRTPKHPKKSHVVVAKEGKKIKTIRFGEQGAKTAGDRKKGESAKMRKKRKSFKARHRKNIKRGKMSAAYWADKVKW